MLNESKDIIFDIADENELKKNRDKYSEIIAQAPWLLKAKFKNAKISPDRLNLTGEITWHDGIWKDGTWNAGCWIQGKGDSPKKWPV